MCLERTQTFHVAVRTSRIECCGHQGPFREIHKGTNHGCSCTWKLFARFKVHSRYTWLERTKHDRVERGILRRSNVLTRKPLKMLHGHERLNRCDDTHTSSRALLETRLKISHIHQDPENLFPSKNPLTLVRTRSFDVNARNRFAAHCCAICVRNASSSFVPILLEIIIKNLCQNSTPIDAVRTLWLETHAIIALRRFVHRLEGVRRGVNNVCACFEHSETSEPGICVFVWPLLLRPDAWKKKVRTKTFSSKRHVFFHVRSLQSSTCVRRKIRVIKLRVSKL